MREGVRKREGKNERGVNSEGREEGGMEGGMEGGREKKGLNSENRKGGVGRIGSEEIGQLLIILPCLL